MLRSMTSFASCTCQACGERRLTHRNRVVRVWKDSCCREHIEVVAHLPAKDKHGDDTLSASTTSSPPDTAHVLRRIAREVEQDDVLHIGCINAAGCTVRADEHHALIVIRSGEELLSCTELTGVRT